MNKRFSKATVIAAIEAQREAICRRGVRFNENDGWDQVRGRGEETNRSYGEWRALGDLMRDIVNGSL